MAKSVADSVLDAALDKIATSNQMLVCSAEPTDRANALALALADVAMAGGDFTNADGDTSGRKVTVAQKTGVLIDTTGTANHVALIDASELLYVTTATPQALTAGNNVTVNSWKVEIADPT